MPDLVGEGLVTIIPDSSAFNAKLAAEITAATKSAGASISTNIDAELMKAGRSAKALAADIDRIAVSSRKVSSAGISGIAASAERAAAALADLTLSSAAVNSTLDAIDSRDLDSVTVSAELATTALLDTAVAAELVDVALASIDVNDLGMVFTAAGTVAGSLAQVTDAALAAAAAINSISSDDLIRVAVSGAAATSQLGLLAAASTGAAGAVNALGTGAAPKMAGGFSSASTAALALGAALLALGGYGAYVSGQFEQVDIAFTGILGSAEDASAMVEELKQFAAVTPFEFAGLNEAARKLLGVGFAAEEIIPTLTALGDTAAVLGAGGVQINMVVRALGQIQGKGKVMAQELNQISEQLPGFSAIKAIADGLGVSVGEAFAEVEAGAVSADEGIQLILDGMREFPGAAGAMEAQSQTLLGRLSTFKDTLVLTLNEAFAPLADTLRDLLLPLADALAGPLEQLGPILASVFSLVADALMAFLPAIEELLSEAGPGLIALMDAIADVVIAVAPAFADLAGVVGRLLTSLAPLIEIVAELLVPIAEGLVIVTEFGNGLGAIVLIAAALAVPLATAATSLGLFGTAAGITGGAVIGLQGAIASLTAVMAANPIGLAIVGLTAATVVLATLISQQDDALFSAEEMAAMTDQVSDSFYGQADSLAAVSKGYADLSRNIGQYAMDEGVFADDRWADDIDRIGVSAQQLTDWLQTGEDGLKNFAAAAIDAGEVTVMARTEAGGWAEATSDAVRDMEDSFVGLANSGDILVQGNTDLVGAFIAQENAMRATNKATFDQLVADGKLSEAQATRILDLDEVKGATDTYGAALANLPEKVAAVSESLDANQIPLGQQKEAWDALAGAIANNRVAADDYQQIADDLGVDVDQISGFAKGVSDAIDDMVNDAVSQLPTAATALQTFTDEFEEANRRVVEDINEQRRALLPEGQEWEDDMAMKLEDLSSFQQLGAQDVLNFADALNDSAGSIDQFDQNLQAIDAVSQPVANFLREQGPEAAGKLAEALARMPGQIGPVEEALNNLETQTSEYAATVRKTAVDTPQEAANLAARMTTEFEGNLGFAAATEAEINRVNALLAGIGLLPGDTIVGELNGRPMTQDDLEAFSQGFSFGDGGIVSAPTIALVGEAGAREFILPEDDPARAADLLSQGSSTFLSGLLARLAPSAAAGASLTVPGAPAAAGGAVVNVVVDARGASDPVAVGRAVEDGAARGASELGSVRRAKVMLRTT